MKIVILYVQNSVKQFKKFKDKKLNTRSLGEFIGNFTACHQFCSNLENCKYEEYKKQWNKKKF